MSIEGLKRKNYGRHYNDEDIEIFYKVQLTFEEIGYILDYAYIKPQNGRIYYSTRHI